VVKEIKEARLRVIGVKVMACSGSCRSRAKGVVEVDILILIR
jgi:hypothetical protein